jgi:hypothetical protein
VRRLLILLEKVKAKNSFNVSPSRGQNFLHECTDAGVCYYHSTGFNHLPSDLSSLFCFRKRLQTSQQNKKSPQQLNKNLNNNILQCISSLSFPFSFPSLPLISRWHCFIGRNFGCFVTHEASKFIYFYVGQMGICLFATA